MKPFNLAESRIAQRTYCQTHLNKRIRMIALLASLAVVLVVIAYGVNTVVAARGRKAQADLARIQKRCADITRQTSFAQAQLDQRQWQDQLSKTSALWLSVLSGVLGELPDDVWVTRIETSPKDSTLQVDGRAATYDALSTFVDRLRANSAFADLRLGTVRIVRIGELTCLDFSVPIKLKPKSSNTEQSPATQANAETAGGSGA